MYPQQQQPGAQYPGQGYPQQQYPQQYQPAPQQYQQPPQQPVQPQAPVVPQGPQKDMVVADEFKKFVQSQSWQVLDHGRTPGQHIIKLAPPAGRKLVKGDVKKAQIIIRSMGPQPSAPGASPPAPNSIQVSLDTEEKAGFFGSDRKSYPLWLNADEEVDAAMQPTIGLKDKVRNICTQAKITLPPPPPAPPQQPPAMLAPAPGYPPQPQQQPGAPLAAPPPVPAAPPQQPQAPPAPMQPTYQPPPQQYQAQAPPPAYQQQPAPQQWVAQPQPTQYGAPPAQQPQAQPQQWQQRICPNPNCQAPNAPNTVTCYRCGYRLQ